MKTKAILTLFTDGGRKEAISKAFESEGEAETWALDVTNRGFVAANGEVFAARKIQSAKLKIETIKESGS
jgi:hypothetical protein